MRDRDREQFDQILERIFKSLPPHLYQMLERVPVLVEDRVSAKLRKKLGLDLRDDLFGLHTGVPLTHRSVEGPSIPGEDHIYLFREPILRRARGDLQALEREIRVTLLHEIGHHFGLDEDDLADLGYA